MKDRTRIELEALITEREGMLAANATRAYNDYSPTYSDDAFNSLADRMRALAETENVGSDVSRRCGTCVHCHVPENEPPCYDCFNRYALPNWTHAPTEPPPNEPAGPQPRESEIAYSARTKLERLKQERAAVKAENGRGA